MKARQISYGNEVLWVARLEDRYIEYNAIWQITGALFAILLSCM